MTSLVVETQLDKDMDDKSGVIPIWPWLDGDGKPKDGLPPNIYANMLLEAKRANGEDGGIIRCHHDGCEHDTKSMFWRSVDTDESVVPPGWTNFGGIAQFTYCSSCRARDIQDIGLDEEAEYERVDINLKHGSTGSSGASDKPLRPLTVSLPRLERPNKRRKLNEVPGLKRRARELWKNHPKHLKAVLQEIDNDERKKRANAAESRKRKRTGGRRKKRRKTRRTTRRRSRRRMRGKRKGKRKGKSRRKSRR